ncbi:MAG: hypothetical protein JW912_00490 [Sedimentisphaerales bacterium]|nr:hypothetical protein [Sedimentisphaerales bacterium]
MNKNSLTIDKLVFILLLCGGVIFFCASCDKTENKEKSNEPAVSKVFERGPLAVTLQLKKDHITIAETIDLQLIAKSTPDYKVQLPTLKSGEADLEDMELIDSHRADDRLDENNNIISSVSFRLEPFTTGSVAIPAITVDFYSPDDPDKKQQIITDPVDVQVDSIMNLPPEAQPELADIADVKTVPADLTIAWIAIIIVVIIAALIFRCYWKNRNAPKIIPHILKSAHELALEKLNDLLEEDLLSKGMIKLFYIRISNVLRYYIEHRFSINAPDKTTEEFLYELAGADGQLGADKKMLAEFLTHCDLVKFAKYDPSPDQNEKTIKIVRDFICKTASEIYQVDITDGEKPTQFQEGV